MTLTLKFDLLLKNFNLGHNFLNMNDLMINDDLHMVAAGELCCLSDNSGYWPCDLDLLLNNFNLGHSFQTGSHRT